MSEKIDLGSELMHDSCPKHHYSTSTIVKGMLPSAIAFLVVAAIAAFLMAKVMKPIIILIILGGLFLLMLLGMTTLFRGLCKRLSETHISVCEYGIEGVLCLGQTNSSFCVEYEDISRVQTGPERIVITVPYGTLNLIVHKPEELAELIREKAGLNEE